MYSHIFARGAQIWRFKSECLIRPDVLKDSCVISVLIAQVLDKSSYPTATLPRRIRRVQD